MAKFKYYYDLLSQPCRSLYIIFKISKTPFESCPISLLKGDQFRKDFKNINRFRKVPCIIDSDGFKLSETVAILRYVDSMGLISKNLYPNDKNIRARVDEYMQWHHLNTRLSCVTYLTEKVLAPAVRNVLASPEQLKKSKNNLEETMNQIEDIWLKDQKFFAGNVLTAADIMAACEIQSVYFASYNPTNTRPKMKAWLKNVRTECNPYFDEVHQNWDMKIKGFNVLNVFLPTIVRLRKMFVKSKN